MTDLLLNARFLSRPPTGVDRVATELMAALSVMDLPTPFSGLRGVRPAGAISQPEARHPALLRMTRTTYSRLAGHAWEQVSLARADPLDWLMSLCNMGPALRRRQIAMIHDAQVFTRPESYSRAFRSWYRTIQPQLGHTAQMVLTVSEHSRRDLERFRIVPAGKARVIPNGADHILRNAADTTVLPRHNLEAGGYFLAIGSLAAHKNLDMLVAAAEARRDRSMPLVIAGGGNAQVFRGAGIAASDGVRLLGRVDDAELRALYENATALVFPSLAEGFGLPPVEAMFCGCPVIASDSGAIPEVCGDAVLTLDPRDEAAWTRAMEKVARDTALRQRLVEAGRARAMRFTWKRAAETLLGHLSDLPKS